MEQFLTEDRNSPNPSKFRAKTATSASRSPTNHPLMEGGKPTFLSKYRKREATTEKRSEIERLELIF